VGGEFGVGAGAVNDWPLADDDGAFIASQPGWVDGDDASPGWFVDVSVGAFHPLVPARDGLVGPRQWDQSVFGVGELSQHFRRVEGTTFAPPVFLVFYPFFTDESFRYVVGDFLST